MKSEVVTDNKMINRLKVVLAEKNRTGKWLAQQLGKNEATVSRWCSNTAQPSLEMVIKIASVLKNRSSPTHQRWNFHTTMEMTLTARIL